MISVSNLGKSYGERVLFDGVTLNLSPGCCYGLVGANGSGKSTFLRIVAGEETPSAGSVSIPKRVRLGLLRQDQFLSDAQPIIEVAMMGHREVFDAMHEKDRLLALPAEEFDGDRFHELEEVITKNDGYTLEARAGAVLEGLGIPTAVHRQALSTLSGGFKLRVLLGQALASDPDVLLLDEPTNHLDILSIRWLEKFLVDFKGMAMVISHDHRFLDNACSDIIDVDYETMIPYPGNYTAFQEAKTSHRDQKELMIERQEKEIARQQAFVERFRAKATKARQAQSRLKMIDRITVDRLPPSSRRHPTFKFTQRRPSGREVVRVEGISKSYGSKRVLEGVGLSVMRGDRVAIIGPNGIGKSTLLKVMVGELTPDAGTVTWGYETWPGYFAQEQAFVKAKPTATVQDWLWDACPGQGIGFVRAQLGLVLFSGEEAGKRLSALSGGEAARLTFARLSVESPNVLVLDEPTNHLDLEAIESLVKGLSSFDGTVILVSHDRWLVARIATRIVEITSAGVQDFRGTYEEYLARSGDDHLDAAVATLQAKKDLARARSSDAAADAPSRMEAASRAGGSTAPASGERAARLDPARLKRRQRDLSARSAQLTSELAEAERRVKEIEQAFCGAQFFAETPRAEVMKLDVERARLARHVEELLDEWERVESELAALGEAGDTAG